MESTCRATDEHAGGKGQLAGDNVAALVCRLVYHEPLLVFVIDDGDDKPVVVETAGLREALSRWPESAGEPADENGVLTIGDVVEILRAGSAAPRDGDG